MFANMKIGKRMTLGFGLLLVIMVALIWKGVGGMSDIQSKLTRIVTINNVRIDAEKENRPIRDGEIVTACQQACPSDSAVLGLTIAALSHVNFVTGLGNSCSQPLLANLPS